MKKDVGSGFHNIHEYTVKITIVNIKGRRCRVEARRVFWILRLEMLRDRPQKDDRQAGYPYAFAAA